MKIEYRKWKIKKATKQYLNNVTTIVEEYGSAGYRMTLRQLYYQLVSKAIIPNKIREYQKLSTVLTNARMAGLVDWDFIEDRIRIPQFHGEYENMAQALKEAYDSFRLKRWKEQENYVEVWVEKDALSGVLLPITDEYHVRLLVNRGYSSASAMQQASTRFLRAEAEGKNCHIIYLGDHDPSGEDMVNDIRKRLGEFWCDVKVKKIALTMDQIHQYRPPPNPAKRTDPRAASYIRKHGFQSWELDALPPDVLDVMLRDALDGLINKPLYKEAIKAEAPDKKKLDKIIKTIFKIENQDLSKDPNMKKCDKCGNYFKPFDCYKGECHGQEIDLLCKLCHRLSAHFYEDRLNSILGLNEEDKDSGEEEEL